ncbi:MAG: DUF4258 domain-containing protein [Lachnospiraceae bacterium]|nr:DUF4258 domain-containing protein [Lachnospiraceae bacterium]
MYSIGDFKSINEPSKMVITQHSRKRFSERGISLNDVCESIKNGEIIEQYPDDYPFPSCLIMGKSGNRVIHVVASIEDGLLYIITAYIPNPDKWEEDWKTRKEDKQ